MMAFAYYRQLLDPTSPANAHRAPSSQVRMDNYPQHYNPPYNASVPNLGYGYNAPYAGGPYTGQPYAPPRGPPPAHDDSFIPPYDNKPPGYTGGDENGGYGNNDSKDPFADFDGPAKPGNERDVTSPPGPDGRNTFR